MQRDGLFPLDYTIKQMNDELTSVRVDAGISLVGNVGVVGASIGGVAGLVVVMGHRLLDLVYDVRHDCCWGWVI